MKNQYLFKCLASLFALVFALSACDKLEDDTSPLPGSFLVLRNDAYTTKVNQTLLLKVLANDSLSGQPTISFGQPHHGTLQQTGTPGNVYYTPDHNFIGLDSVRYQVCLGAHCISAMVKIRVEADSTSNCTVILTDDTLSVYQNQTTLIDILQNDRICNNNNPVISQPAQNGQASLNSSNQLVYTPNLNFSGTDEIRYTLGGATGRVSVRVLAAQPVCTLTVRPDQVNMAHNQPIDSVSINVLANDNWCNTSAQVTVQLVSQSSHGSLLVTGTGAATRILYITNTPLRHTTDRFEYRICQGNVCSAVTTAIINIQ